MKIFLGIFSILLLLAVATLGALAIWNIYPISWEIIWKSGLSLIIVSVALTLLWLLAVLFFKKEKYKEKGNNAHRMN